MADVEGHGGMRRRGKALVERAKDVLSKPWATFLFAVLIVLACIATLVWFVSFSGLNAPAGFVYSQF
jgi:hypothetical protein